MLIDYDYIFCVCVCMLGVGGRGETEAVFFVSSITNEPTNLTKTFFFSFFFKSGSQGGKGKLE